MANLRDAAEPRPESPRLEPVQQAIGRGEAIFNNTTFVVHDVPGINSVPSDPLYNPAEPLAGQDVVAGCGLCHNNPNAGNHSTSLPINIGVTLAQPTNNNGNTNTEAGSGESAGLYPHQLRDRSHRPGDRSRPGDDHRQLDGHRQDQGPNPARSCVATLLHNGSAKDLATVVNFYNQRFNIGLTPEQQSDLVTFLESP
jgi:cytochrome c peroxidase